MNPKPNQASSSTSSAFLSKPAAKPTGFLNFKPKTSRSNVGCSNSKLFLSIRGIPQIFEALFSRAVTKWWIFSGSKENRIGFSSRYILRRYGAFAFGVGLKNHRPKLEFQ